MDNWHKVADRMKQLSKLHDRMDATRKLIYLEDYHLKTYDEKSYLDRVVNITGNQPAVFANAVVSDLMTATWQTVVEGNISQGQAKEIEQFIDDNFEQADEVLSDKFGISSLYAWLCNHVCVRSLIGVRWISQVEGGMYKIDCLPVDMRWCAWRYGKNKLSWVAPLFFSNSDEIKEDYPGALLPGNTEHLLVDYWDDKENEVWVTGGNSYEATAAGTKIFSQQNNLGYPPFVIVLPAVGFMLRDKDFLEHEAEDLLFMNRKLYKEMNRALSIEQTLGMDVLNPPYERETEDFDSEPAQPVPKSGEVAKVKKGERAQPVPRGDLNRASLTARDDLYRQLELGGISDAELGSARLDRPGIWFAKQFEIRHKLEKARFEALAVMKEGLARMMIKQFISSGEGELLVGKTGRRNKFSPKKLGDPDNYRVSFKFGLSSKEMEIVNLAQAQAARGIVPDRIIIRDILQAEDPAGWERELAMQKAKEANPAIMLLEMACRYAEEANMIEDEVQADLLDMQARILLHDYVMTMRQRLSPQPVEAPKAGKPEVGKIAPERANLQGLMSMPKLMAGGGLLGRRQRQEPQPSMEVEGE